MAKLNQYRKFQVDVAPGVYGGLTLIASFLFFLSGGQLLFSLMGWCTLIGILYIDRPFKATLTRKKVKLVVFLSILTVSIFLPPIIWSTGTLMGEFVAIILVPCGGIFMGGFIYFFYHKSELELMGWENISKDFEGDED